MLLAIRAATSTAVRLFMARLIHLVGRKLTLAASLALAAVGLSLVPVSGGSTPILIGLMVATGLGLGIGQPMTISWAAGRVPRDVRATAGASGVSRIFLLLGFLLSSSGGLVATATFTDAPQTSDSPEMARSGTWHPGPSPGNVPQPTRVA